MFQVAGGGPGLAGATAEVKKEQESPLTTDSDYLRPFERRVVAMRSEGTSIDDIAQRFRRSPDHVRRVLQWTTISRNGPPNE